jgi:putative DNA primase/helicase
MLADARARLAEARKLSGPERAAAMARAADDIAWAKRSQNHKSLVAMLAVASSYPFIALRHQDLDGEPMLLNCTNGEIDLVTGTLHPHRRESLCTKLVPIAYDSDAKAPRWEQFVSETMAGDPAKIGYLQRSVGYGITGDVREDALFFFYGTGANGKSTFIRIITEMLGTDYAGPAPRQLLLLRRGEHHPTELAGLFRQRWVTCSEISDGAALDEALVKDLTGRDLIEVRRMREDFWTFAPTHKLIMAGNYKPRITGTDDGIWRRVRLVPWLVTFAKDQQDKGLTKKLRAELAGILAWAVRGCLEWQQSGLGEPESVLAATAEYRSDSDSLGRFIRERLTFAPGESVARKVVRATYETWAEDEGCQPVGARRLADRLRAGGARETSKRPAPGQPAVDAWGDLRLATDDERAARRGVDETVPATSETTTGNATTTVPSAAADMAPRGVNVAATGLAIVVGSASPEASTAGPSIKTPVTENIVTPAFDGMPHAPANDLDDREEIDL